MINTENDFDKELADNFKEEIRKINERISLLKNVSSKFYYGGTNLSSEFLLSGSYKTNLSIASSLNKKVSESGVDDKIDMLTEAILHMQEQYESLLLENKVKDERLKNELSKINHIEYEYKELNEKFYQYVNNRENDLSIQYLNTEIYLDTDNPDDIFQVYTSVLDFLEEIDFKVYLELDAVKGSWWKKFIAKSGGAFTSEQVTSRLKEAEYALEVKILKDQSEVEKNQSEALTNIILSLKDVPNAAIRIGSLLVVKVTNEEGVVSLNVQTLSLTQLHYLNKNPNLMNQPRNIWDQLSRENDDKNLSLQS
ncbi:hypothetical protein [Sphingobacterium sp. UDSM-2020]|uniref:hypothetical protein n=1 Tax=Sphingobacterium sp. UDSM-2020 TaxID=2795738 RepID=UPI0019367DE6|nr:hypothetical protein [Sphingobacterium sp. UDSM-2020]QQD12350.1 hypothetical protein JAZ75_17295 [Sphingobacterium sp. UDSM-2020]